MRILLIDHDRDQADLTAYARRGEGFYVTQTGYGQQALARWDRDRPDLVILDLNLPRLDGLEVCRRLRETADTPIIILTARDTDAAVVQALHLGADDYVVKPFSAPRLVARIRAVARRSIGRAAAEAPCRVQVGNL